MIDFNPLGGAWCGSVVRRFRKLALSGLLLCGCTAANAKIIYVDSSKSGSGNGTTWGQAFVNLQDALAISKPGDALWVADGTYFPDIGGPNGLPGDRELSFVLDQVSIYGGFSGNESNLSQRDPVLYPTILSGEIFPITPQTQGFQRYWSLHVIVLKGSSILDGLIVEKGRANGDENPANQGGGALVPAGLTLTVANCIFRGNLAAESGGAISGEVIVTDSTFSDNLVNNEFLLVPNKEKNFWLFSPDCKGGAISGNVKATNTKFLRNEVDTRSLDLGNTTSATGGAIAGTTINLNRCHFESNEVRSLAIFTTSGSQATSRGGAVSGDTVATNCTFINNLAEATSVAFDGNKTSNKATSSSFGGAIAGQVTLTNCSFSGNETDSVCEDGDVGDCFSHGGAVYAEKQSLAVNCTFYQNNSRGGIDFAASTDPRLNHFTSRFGGGVYATSTSTTSFPLGNCTFVDNGTDGNGSSLCVNGNVNILSNIFWYTTDSNGSLDLNQPIHVSGKSRVSNRLYPSPTTETLNILKGGIKNVTDSPGANMDFGEPSTRTLLETDPLFVDVANPAGLDGIWRTADDGLRLNTGSGAVGFGKPAFLPTDFSDLDGDGNILERTPYDAAGFGRIQDETLDLGAYELGNNINSPDIAVDRPLGTSLVDGLTTVDLSAFLGIPQTFIIKNTGPADLRNLVVTVVGANPTAFVVTQPATKAIDPGETTSFTVTFKPLVSGISNAVIQIASNDPDENPFDINVTGDASLPEIAVQDPVGTILTDAVSSYNFGSVLVPNSLTAKFTITNSGVGNLNIAGITSSGPHAADFVIVPPLQTVIAPNGSTTFDVVFTPSGTGARNAAITIVNNDPDAESSFLINMVGNGLGTPEIFVSQPFPNNAEIVTGSTNGFGSVKTTSSYTKTFNIKNDGTADLTGLSLAMSGSKNFKASALTVNALKPGERAKFTVTLKPTSAGIKNAVLRITSNDGNESIIDINLVGKGVVPARSNGKSRSAASFAKVESYGPSDSAVTVAKANDGLKYLVLTIEKPANWAVSNQQVEVSSNLVDWFSGKKHTTVLSDTATQLKVRDNTPYTPETKRYIRLK